MLFNVFFILGQLLFFLLQALNHHNFHFFYNIVKVALCGVNSLVAT